MAVLAKAETTIHQDCVKPTLFRESLRNWDPPLEDLSHYWNHIHQGGWPDGHMAGTFAQTIIHACLGRNSLH